MDTPVKPLSETVAVHVSVLFVCSSFPSVHVQPPVFIVSHKRKHHGEWCTARPYAARWVIVRFPHTHKSVQVLCSRRRLVKMFDCGCCGRGSNTNEHEFNHVQQLNVNTSAPKVGCDHVFPREAWCSDDNESVVPG